MSHATINGVHFPIDPTSVQWDFQVKVAEQDTIGGKVVQVLGVRLGDMTVSGKFATWEQSLGFLHTVEGWIDKQVQTATSVGQGAGVSGGKPLRFTFAPRHWDFHVYIKSLTDSAGNSVSFSAGQVAPDWTLTLFIVQDNTNLLRTIQDRFLARLMDGIGWRQSKYNGPVADVDAGTARDALLANFKKAYGGG